METKKWEKKKCGYRANMGTAIESTGCGVSNEVNNDRNDQVTER